jgi:hypothetical protein
MSKKTLFVMSLLIILTLALATVAQAKNTKYTFNDVQIGEQTLEITAGVKETNQNDYSNCSYFSDDFQESLGYYADDVIAGDTAEEVLDFCVSNFDNRTQ